MADVQVSLPDGGTGSVPEEDLQAALQAGARVTTAEEKQAKVMGSTENQVAAFVSGADENFGGLGTSLGSTIAEGLYGKANTDAAKADIRSAREANSGLTAAGGVVGGFLVPGIGLELGAESALGRIGVTALEGAAQGAIGNLGHAMTEEALGNPEANAEGYFAEQMASGFLLGGAAGGALGGLGEGIRRAGTGALGSRLNSRAIGELGAAVTGSPAAGKELVAGYRGAEGAVDEIMGLGKYTLGEARKVVGDAEALAKRSVTDQTVGGVFETYMQKVAADDPELGRVLRTQYENGAKLASKSDSELDDMARQLAERGDKVLGLEDTLYDESITAKGRKMAELVDPAKHAEAVDAAVSMARSARQFAQDAEGLMGGAGLANNVRKEVDRFEAAIQGRAAEVSAAETKATAKLTDATAAVTAAEERVAAAEKRIADAAAEGPGASADRAARIKELERAKALRETAASKVERLDLEAAAASKLSLGAAAPTAVSAADVFMAADNFKRNMGRLQKQIGNASDGAIKPAFLDFYENSLRAPLENPAVWGDAAATAQRDVNQAWTQRLATRNDLGNAFLSDFGKADFATLERADAGKFKGYLKNISGPENDLKREALGKWLDGLDHAMTQTEKHYGSLPAYAESRKTIAEMRDLLETSAQKAKTLEALNTQKLSEGDGLGGALGLVSDVFTRPLKTAERLAAVKGAVDKFEAAAKTVVSSLFEGAKGRTNAFIEGAAAARAGVGAAERARVKESSAAVRRMTQDPAGFMASLQKRMEGLAASAPNHARALSVVASRAITHLAQHAPAGRQSFSPLRGDGEVRYTDSEIDSFARRLRVVEDPLSVVRDAANGKLSIEQMQTLKEVYPSIYEGIRTRAWNEIQSMKKTGKIDQIPYGKRLSIGILLDIASDDTMEPDFIQMIQASKAGEGAQSKDQPAPKAPSPQRGVPRRVTIESANSLQTKASRIEGDAS